MSIQQIRRQRIDDVARVGVVHLHIKESKFFLFVLYNNNFNDNSFELLICCLDAKCYYVTQGLVIYLNESISNNQFTFQLTCLNHGN